VLADVSRELLGRRIAYSDEELARIMSPRHFVEVRRTLGGPAPEETARALEASHEQLKTDDAWRAHTAGALAAAERKLAAESNAL